MPLKGINQKGESKTDTVIKLVLVLFVSLLSFSVGTFVGKQFSDSEHRLASLESEYNNNSKEQRSTASIPDEIMEMKKSNILSNEDVAKLAEEFVQEEKIEKPKTREVANAPASTAETSEASPAEKIAQDQEPIKVKPAIELRKAEPLPNTVAGDTTGKYTIQVSSHMKEEEAKSKVEELNKKGFISSYVTADVDGKTWYRVGVGAFATVKSAKNYLNSVKDNGTFHGAIIRQIAQ